jgi:nitrous oxide reductase accessory protein NosL
MRPKSSLRAKERDKKVKWLREIREKLQHFSVPLRPITIRMMYVRDVVQKEEHKKA